MNYRDLARILAANAERTADAVHYTYVRPAGNTGRHLVENPATGKQFIVGSALPERTWKPGTSVPVLRPRGGPDKIIVGNPGESRSGTRFPPQRRTFPQPIAPTADGMPFLAFCRDDTRLVLASYSPEGVFIDDLAETSGEFSLSTGAMRIGFDPEEIVGPNSFVWHDANLPGLRCWDPTGSAVHNYTESGFTASRAASHIDGWIYWAEYSVVAGTPPDQTHTLKLMRARCDFSGVETLHSMEMIDDGREEMDVDWGHPNGWVCSSTAALVIFAKDFGGIPVFDQIKIPLLGGSHAEAQEEVVPFLMPIPTATEGQALGIEFNEGSEAFDGDDRILLRADSPSGVASSPWPATANWKATDYLVANADMTGDAAYGLLYGRNDFGTAATSNVAIVDSLPSTASLPLQRVTLADHPELGVPFMVFFNEEP